MSSVRSIKESKKIYNQKLKDIFGEANDFVDVGRADSNNVIGAYKYDDEFSTFRKNFEARIFRLKTNLDHQPRFKSSLYEKVKNICLSSNWSGSMAELTAFDYMFNAAKFPVKKAEFDKPIDARLTLANLQGMNNIDQDLVIWNWLFFDVKVLANNVEEFLQTIFSEVEKTLRIKMGVVLSLDYAIDINDLSRNRRAIQRELETGIKTSLTNQTIRSSIVSGLTYNIVIGAGVAIGVNASTLDDEADKLYKLLFVHSKKYMRKKPFVLIFTHHPWYGINKANEEERKKLYRNICDKFFLKNKATGLDASTVYGKLPIGTDAHDLSTYLSGVIFIDDNSALSEKTESHNSEAYLYLNPYAKNTLLFNYYFQFKMRKCHKLRDYSFWEKIKYKVYFK